MDLNQIASLILFLAILFYTLKTVSHNYYHTQALQNSPTGLVKHFGVAITIADLPDKHAEGGFYLYFTSPDLHIRKMLAYNFERGATVVGTFSLEDRYIDWETFRLTLDNATFSAQSPNIYNAERVEVYGILHNGQKFHAEKQVDSAIDRTLESPIYLDNLEFQFL